MYFFFHLAKMIKFSPWTVTKHALAKSVQAAPPPSADFDITHVIKSPRPSHGLSHCKQWKAGHGLGMRPIQYHNDGYH